MRSQTSSEHTRVALVAMAVLACLAALAVAALLAACGGGGTGGPAGPGTFKGGTYKQALAYARCMRAHGVTGFPDPDRQGNFSDSQLQLIDHSVPQAQGANAQCRGLLANGGFQGSATELQQYQEQLMRRAEEFSVCMRAHGFPDYPDPRAGPGGTGEGVQIPPGMDIKSAQFQSASRICGRP